MSACRVDCICQENGVCIYNKYEQCKEYKAYKTGVDLGFYLTLDKFAKHCVRKAYQNSDESIIEKKASYIINNFLKEVGEIE